MENSSLRITYTDRIIRHKNHQRVWNVALQEIVKTALGEEAEKLWPEFRLLKFETA